MKKVGFVGAGNMAFAIASGISKSKMQIELLVYDISNTKAKKIASVTGTAFTKLSSMVSLSDMILLAVKPSNITEVLQELKPIINHDTVIISIAAGISDTYIQKELGYDAKVILVMPNAPLLRACGASAISRNKFVNDEEFELVKNVFASAGSVCEIPEDKMNDVIPLNGSSPAFIYSFARCFIEYGKSAGFDEETATKLFAQTLIGSGKMILEAGLSIDELIDMVSSKGGTTIEGLTAFNENNALQGIVDEACKRCVNRAREISK